MESLTSINIRCPVGNKVLQSIDLTLPLSSLLILISKESGILAEALIIKKGFPPKPIVIDEVSLTKSLVELGVRPKDSLIVDEDKSKV